MQFSATQIAALLDGEVDGDAQVLVSDLAKIEEGKPGSLTFLANAKYTDHLYSTEASIAVVARDFLPTQPLPKRLTLIRVDDPRACFSRLLKMNEGLSNNKRGIEQPSFVSPKAKVAPGAYIGAFSYIGEGAVIEEGAKIFPHCTIGDNVHIGKDTCLHANVSVYHRCVVGANCIIHSGAVIGADGYGFVQNDKGEQEKMPQVGNVIIEDQVEIGANTTVDRATLGHTIIRKGAKLDNLIQVGHNVEIGAHTLVVAQTGIAGSTRIGEHCVIGGQVGIVGHLHIGNRVKVAAQSGVSVNLPDDAVVQGSPAYAIGDYKRSYVLYRNLPEIKQQIDQLKKELDHLKAASAASQEGEGR
ncbi:MAG: UDP-3-O-(3-hydroxymyristoyl)glucosamine N-acyltransferase [Flavobacteriales bacterium]|nr:UDP-3-O-(3-hydroxymyristoyl)glucosamine N-acyltransferase [Flavobacteriales bacterium]MBP9080959.1 UDP-3-O-(3-hydroxymyristoyl)glucosamine N-acyltransferase [Flavobacteriales bacterium]